MEILLLSLLVPASSSLSLSTAALAKLSPLSASCLYPCMIIIVIVIVVIIVVIA